MNYGIYPVQLLKIESKEFTTKTGEKKTYYPFSILIGSNVFEGSATKEVWETSKDLGADAIRGEATLELVKADGSNRLAKLKLVEFVPSA